MITELIWLSLIGGLISLFGALILIWWSEEAKRIINSLIAFAAGAFLSAGLLDILPEAMNSDVQPRTIFVFVIFGFTLFFIFERLLMKYVCSHSSDTAHSDHTESLPPLLILGDSIHNFLDGILIGLAYLTNPAVGFATALAVAAHEIPQEIGDASVLLGQGWSRVKIIWVNVLQSLLTLPGALIGFYLGHIFWPYLPYLLAGTAGVFIYIAATDLIPELHHRASHKHGAGIILPFILGVGMVWYLVSLAG